MSRDWKFFISGVVAFYALGVFLGAVAYALDNFDFFVLVATIWIKVTMFAVVFGMAYWLYHIIAVALGWRGERS
jgi:hypothetical protein